MTAAEPAFGPDTPDEDLPRTLRRAKQERAQQIGYQEPAHAPRSADPRPTPELAGPASLAAPDAFGPEPTGAVAAYDGPDDRVTVTRFEVPFFSLMGFFIKAVLAAIPALLLLGAILWGAGVVLKMYFPWLIQTEILIRFPN